MRANWNSLARTAALTLAAALAACGSIDRLTPANTGTSTLQSADCSRLAGMAIPASSFAHATGGAVVDSATPVAAAASGNVNGDYCQVTGVIRAATAGAPDMRFQVNLPAAWNRKVVQMGGGGYDGTLVTGLTAYIAQPAGSDTPLKRGYATLGSDGGHQGTGSFDARFALNDEALLTYGQQSVKKAHDAAMAVIQKAYGRAPARFYFIGGSQGGHEALDAAARYFADYDGVIANYPSYNIPLLNLAMWNVGKALYDNGGAGWLNPAKKDLLAKAVYAACDKLDGLQDNIIGNVAACNAAFNIAAVRETLRCPGGTDTGNTCLSDAQINAVEQISSPFNLGYSINGQSSFPRWPILEGGMFNVATLGRSQTPTNPPSSSDNFHWQVGAAFSKYMVTKNPALDALTFNPRSRPNKARILELGSIMDVGGVSLARFRAKGGKLILTHGMADDLISPHNTVAYYQKQLAEFGQSGVDSFIRFYEIPGYVHGFGTFNAGYEGLAVLEDWVERGQAPDVIVAKDNNPNANRTRPMCRYPAYPRFTGAAGTENVASSFTCVSP